MPASPSRSTRGSVRSASSLQNQSPPGVRTTITASVAEKALNESAPPCATSTAAEGRAVTKPRQASPATGLARSGATRTLARARRPSRRSVWSGAPGSSAVPLYTPGVKGGPLGPSSAPSETTRSTVPGSSVRAASARPSGAKVPTQTVRVPRCAPSIWMPGSRPSASSLHRQVPSGRRAASTRSRSLEARSASGPSASRAMATEGRAGSEPLQAVPTMGLGMSPVVWMPETRSGAPS